MAVSPSSAVGIVAAQRRREIESGRDERKWKGSKIKNGFNFRNEGDAPLYILESRLLF